MGEQIAATLTFPAFLPASPTIAATPATTSLLFTYVENKSELKLPWSEASPPVAITPGVPFIYSPQAITFLWAATQTPQSLQWNRDTNVYKDPAANTGNTILATRSGPVTSPSVLSSNSNSLSTPAPSLSSAATSAANNTSSSSIPSATATSRPSSGGVSSGAAAGIGIGCAIAGAFIAAILLIFCGRKRRAGRAGDPEPSRSALIAQEKGFTTPQALPVQGRSLAASPLASILPLPLEDKLITSEISKISNLIKNHIQSYYHISRVNPTLVDHDDLRPLGKNLPLSAEKLSSVLLNPATREIGLRFCLAWVVVRGMRWNKDLENTFLPSEISRCLEAIEIAGMNSRDTTPLTAQWRVMTAHLMQPAYTQNAFGPSDSRNTRIQAAINRLDGILQPFADPRIDNEQRRRNLEEILKRSAGFALTLFSQPNSWDFDWNEQQYTRTGDLCIFPALLQLTDETGEPISPPRTFSEATLRRLEA